MNMSEAAKEQNPVIHATVKSANAISKLSSRSVRTSKMTRTNATTIPITYDPCQFKSKYTDEYTGEILGPALISDAIIDERDYLNDHVWRIEDKATMFSIKDHVFARSRWVMGNKGDRLEPDMRAR